MLDNRYRRCCVLKYRTQRTIKVTQIVKRQFFPLVLLDFSKTPTASFPVGVKDSLLMRVLTISEHLLPLEAYTFLVRKVRKASIRREPARNDTVVSSRVPQRLSRPNESVTPEPECRR